MCDTCDDSRFELIGKYKQKLLDATNIEGSPEEMAVIDSILFRFWQMGWLKDELFGNSEQLDDTISRQAAIDAVCEDGTQLERQGQYSMTMAERKQRDVDILETLPSAQPVSTYQTCSNALLKMWMDNVLIDGEYNRIMDKLNAWKGNADADHD